MKLAIFLLFSLISGTLLDFNKVREINQLKEKAVFAYEQKDYILSIKYHSELIAKKNKEEDIYLNLANSYFKINDFYSAHKYYKMCQRSDNPKILSIVNLQIGNIYAYQGKEKIALKYFKESLKADYFNYSARFNYEYLRKKLIKDSEDELAGNKQINKNNTEHKNRKQDDTSEKDNTELTEEFYSHHSDELDSEILKGETAIDNNSLDSTISNRSLPYEDLPNQEKNNKLKTEEEGQQEKNALVSKRFEEIKISEAKAKMILDQMKTQEFLFINRIRQKTIVKDTTDRPDW